MPRFFRATSIAVCLLGLFAALTFFSEARPAEPTRGFSDPILIWSGIGVIVGALFSAVTWWAFAEMLESLRAIKADMGIQRESADGGLP